MIVWYGNKHNDFGTSHKDHYDYFYAILRYKLYDNNHDGQQSNKSYK